MTRKARFTQGDITRAIRGAKGAGCEHFRVQIAVDGAMTVEVFPEGQAEVDQEIWSDDDI